MLAQCWYGAVFSWLGLNASCSILILQKQKALTTAMKNKQLLHFGFCTTIHYTTEMYVALNVTEAKGFSYSLRSWKTCTISFGRSYL